MHMDKNELKKLLCQAVDSVKGQTKAFADDVAAHAELGFFETRTSDKLAAALEGLGLDVTRGLARTGLRADMAGGAEGPKVAVIGELDGIVCRQPGNLLTAWGYHIVASVSLIGCAHRGNKKSLCPHDAVCASWDKSLILLRCHPN